MNDLHERFDQAAEAAPPMPDVWAQLDAGLARARRRRQSGVVAAVAVAAVAVAVPVANGWIRQPSPTPPAATATDRTGASPSANRALELRGAPSTWRAADLAKAEAAGVSVPSEGSGTWTASPSGKDGVLLWEGAGDLPLPGEPVANPMNFGAGVDVSHTDDGAHGVTYLRLWAATGDPVIVAVRGADDVRSQVLFDVASTSLPDRLGRATIPLVVEDVRVAVPIGCRFLPAGSSPVTVGPSGVVDAGTPGAVEAQLRDRTALCGVAKVTLSRYAADPRASTDDAQRLSDLMLATAEGEVGAETGRSVAGGRVIVQPIDDTNRRATVGIPGSGAATISIHGGPRALFDRVLGSMQRS